MSNELKSRLLLLFFGTGGVDFAAFSLDSDLGESSRDDLGLEVRDARESFLPLAVS